MKKYALVHPEELKKWKQNEGINPVSQEYHTVDPRLNAMARLDTVMENTLESGSRMNTDQKATVYSQALQEFLDLKERGYIPRGVSQQNQMKRELGVSDIAKTVPKNFKTKAEQLAEWIKQTGTMSWDETGRLIVDGTPVDNTNIIDLINDALRRRKKFSPYGRDIFAENLKKRNAPHELVGNDIYWGEKEGPNSTSPQPSPEQATPSTSRAGKRKPSRLPVSVQKKSSKLNWSTDINL
jgi:hypothetical protein